MENANSQETPHTELDKLRKELLLRIIKNEEQRRQRTEVSGK